MRFFSMFLPILILLAGLGGCVSEKSFDEVMQQLEGERTKAEAVRKEMELLKKEMDAVKEENAGLASQLAELRESAASGDQAGVAAAAAQKERIKKLQAKIAEQEAAIRSLSEKPAAPVVRKPDMAWARNLTDQIGTVFKEEVRDNRIQSSASEDRTTITLSEALIFERDGVDITVDGEELLARLGELLQRVKDHEMVVGAHLDTTPIAPVMAPDFPTAWDFTGARAIEVVRFLQEESKISGKTLSAAAYGSARPVASNTSETGRAQNRRIEITLLP